ncbi:MAG: hypothetical protein WDW36_004641 [Sanguina aurantia]
MGVCATMGVPPWAFTLALASMGISPEVFFSHPVLMKSILLYHFLLDETLETSDITDSLPVVTANTKPVTFKLIPNGVSVDGLQSSAVILRPDIYIGPAFTMHTIDNVLIP